jgi:hypothetical protein
MKKNDDDKDSYLSDEELLSVLSEIVSIAKLLVNRNFSDDPILQRQKKRFADLPPEVRDKINALDNMHPRDYQLKVIKRKRTKPVQTPNFGHYAAITSGFKSFLMIALWYSLGGLSLRLP